MAQSLLSKTIRRFWRQSRVSQSTHSTGFTLLELLIVTVIAGGIVSGLVYMVVQLMGSDQREASRTDTQREVRLAMDYIANDLQSAVYVYDSACIRGNGAAAGSFCHGILSYLPTSLQAATNLPVLAFWKQQPLPDTLRNACSGSNPPTNVPCISGNSYALVVYSLNTDNTGGIWKGKARINRYVLQQFKQDGTANSGYVDPGRYGNFDIWPYTVNPTTQQVSNPQQGTPDGSAQPLVDFVDNGEGAASLTPRIPNGGGNELCPNANLANPDYEISPASNQLGSFATLPRSFYACISDGTSLGENREVVLFVRGNAYGRPGITSPNGFLPTLETRVLARGVLQRNPGG